MFDHIVNEMKHFPHIQPGDIFVAKKNGTRETFDIRKVTYSIFKAFIAAEGDSAKKSEHVRLIANNVTNEVHETLKQRMHSGGYTNVEEIKDLTELGLLRCGETQAGKMFFVQRENAMISHSHSTGIESGF